MSAYSEAFYRYLDTTAEPSARRVLPLLFDLVDVASVVDVGCGDGGWLRVAAELGAADILGLDGPWIDEKDLKIPHECFRRVRLGEPFAIGRRFDLAISLEVAEHLPAAQAADFVNELTHLGPLVLFSAAVPGQGGVGHLNEQWPAYWARLFAARGYRAVDVLRPRIWADPAVSYWYKQNLLLFASDAALDANPRLGAAAEGGPAEPAALVHPDLFGLTSRRAHPGFGRWLKMAPAALGRSLRRRRRRD